MRQKLGRSNESSITRRSILGRVGRLGPTAALLSLATLNAVSAQVPMSGTFTAEASCFATSSLRPDDNPGRIVTEPGRGYDLFGRNAVPGSHYLIRVPGASPERRWVAYGCGRVGEESSSAANRSYAPASPSRASVANAIRGDFILAASWHPAFCELRSRTRDCREGGTAAGGFSLHGLWPQPRGREYCGVSASIRAADEAGDWRALPAVALSTQTRAALAQAMPGVVSGLDRHEWWTHGTCYGTDAETYFRDALALLGALNASDVGRLFTSSVGDEVSTEEIRAAFDRAFGRGAGRRVLVDCASDDGGRRLVRELRIALRGTVGAAPDLGRLVLAGAPQSRGCAGGVVDAAGFG
ncbi:ribonuclease T2 family protein [Aureimonas pseudogalii]|uniref:Ribonuclease T2 n=1 Tax=Aureimonas pseudogalii TaxID=1744844 RepID=A0A7W6EC29_9HYPH|nr:ribonuclease [Aureimonas pseudogalii]MBB3998109.1 ribonuclease T2 [Aureimonas pseudogalii]